MKTSGLKRKTPLKANPDKPLRSKTTLKVANSRPLKRAAFKARPMPLKTLKLRCDVLWRTYVKREGHCTFTFHSNLGPCSGALQAAHLIPRSQSSRIKYHPDNGIPLCVAHHMMLDGKSIGTRHAIAEIDRMYPGRYDMLEALAATKTPVKAHEWRETLERLKAL